MAINKKILLRPNIIDFEGREKKEKKKNISDFFPLKIQDGFLP